MKRLIGRALMTAVLGFLPGFNVMASEIEAVPGEYVVKFKDSFSVQKNYQVLSTELGKSYIKDIIPNLNVVVIKRPVFEIQHNVLKAIAQNANVDVVEPNFIYKTSRLSNDPMLGELWGLINVGQLNGISGIDIGAEAAWDITIGNKDIIVAVIDTGVDYTHPDIAPNMWVNEAEKNGLPGVDDDGNGIVDDIYGANFVNASLPTGDPKDDNGHGTHCSGTIGAAGNDGKGIVGVAWNVRIMGVKFLSASGGGSLDGALKGIDYATTNGARIMNNSWGGGGESATLKAAIERANDAGVLFIAASGNERNNNDSRPTFPANYNVPNVLSVAAVDSKGKLASFSNYGKNTVHVGAPGVGIKSSVTKDRYASFDGTSMAAPHVSGMAVLLLSNEPNITHHEMKERIIATSKPIDGLRGRVRGGMANAYTMLTNTMPPPDVNDPINWKSSPLAISTAHPYANDSTEVFEVRVAGAQEIALFFEKFDTENSYDRVDLFDVTGKKIASMSGSNDQTFSEPIPGEYVKIVFTSDKSVNRYGFDITKVSWR